MSSRLSRIALAGLVAALLALVTFAVYETVPSNDRAAAAIDITGTWNVTFQGENGWWDCTLNVVQTGGDLSGDTDCGPLASIPLTGTLTKATGDFELNFSWSTVETTGGDDLSGATDGLTMSGTFSGAAVDQFGNPYTDSGTFAGTKKGIDTPTPTDTPTGPTPTPTSTPVPPDMEGKWNVSLTGLFNDQCSLNVTQSGTVLSGTADCVSGGVNPITNGSISNYPLIQLGFGNYGLTGTTNGVMMSGNWFSSSPSGSGTFTGTNKNPDTDGDGCKDAFEQQTGPGLETSGGNRDYTDPNDYYDVLGAGGALTHDGVIDLTNDILGVILHYAPQGQSPYDVRFDRGPSQGPHPWNMTAPDGAIDLTNDILGVILQYGHNCL